MKVYIASSFSLISKVQIVSDFLEMNDHTITVKWWQRAYQVEGLGLIETTELKKKYEDLSAEEFYSRPETKLSYEYDFQGVKDADCLVLVADNYARAYNGANIELGMALALGKPCFSIGVLDNSALYFPVKRCTGIIPLLHEIGNLETE